MSFLDPNSIPIVVNLEAPFTIVENLEAPVHEIDADIVIGESEPGDNLLENPGFQEMRLPGMYIVDGEEQVEFPAEFPGSQIVQEQLLNAVRLCIATNVMRPVHRRLEPLLGDLKTVFDDSIMYREVGMEGSTDMFTGPIAVQQTLGRILHDDAIMSYFVNDDNNCLVNTDSMMNTSVYRIGGAVIVKHIMPDSPILRRYLSNTAATISLHNTEGLVSIVWECDYSTEDMSGVDYIIDNLGAVLTIYYKLFNEVLNMSELFDRFAGFREFLDPRQDQLADVYRALHVLQNVDTEDSNEILQIIAGLNVQRISRMYQNKCSEMNRGNSNLNYHLRNVNFTRYKAVIGDNDYV